MGLDTGRVDHCRRTTGVLKEGGLTDSMCPYPSHAVLNADDIQVAQSDAIEEGESVQSTLKDAGFI